MNSSQQRGCQPDRLNNRLVGGLAAIILVGILWPRPQLMAQSSGQAHFREAEQVRRSVDDILTSPEFRHLRRFNRDTEGSGPSTRNHRSDREVDGTGRSGNAQRDTAPGQSAPGETNSDSPPRDTSQEPSQDSSGSMPFFPESAGPVGQFFGFLWTGMAWIVVAIVCGLIIYLVMQAILAYEPPDNPQSSAVPTDVAGEEDDLRPPGEIPADVYVAQATRLAEQGRYREAIAQLILGAMSHLERAGLIRYRRGLTHRDYLRAARSHEPIYRALRGMIRIYEPIGFGRRGATREHFQSSLAGYESGFRETHALRDP